MIVAIEQVSRRFGTVVALDQVSLEIPQGSFFALLGPSGCGKTTLLRMIGGFDFPTEGRIIIDGKDSARIPPNKRPVNMVFQSYAIFPHLSVWENIAYGLKVAGKAACEISRSVAEGVAMAKLEGLEERMPNQLSGGQRQRVALARALVKKPKVLLLDEPLSALDKKLRHTMQNELIRLQREVGITFVIVTHDQGEALAMADQIAVINAGRIVQIDAPRRLYEHPKSRFVADFIGTSNFLECKVERTQDGKASVEAKELGRIDVEMADDTLNSGVLMIRPEKIHIISETSTPAASDITLDAELEQITYQGDLSKTILRLKSGLLIECSQYNTGRNMNETFSPGAPCRIAIHPRDLLLVSA